MPAAHHYRAYGFAIRSDLELPELEPDVAAPSDIVIHTAPTGRELPAGRGKAVFDIGPSAQYLGWSDVGGFLISGCNEIRVEPRPDVGAALLRLPLLGPVMALLLHLKGLLVLHASAAAIGACGAVFMGDKRAGKSTIAAACVAAGHRLLADDVVGVDFSGAGEPQIRPAFPQLKLSTDAADAVIGGDARVLPAALPGSEKRQHRLAGGFLHEAVAATRLYELRRGAAPGVIPLQGQDALAVLLRYSYVSRFPPTALAGSSASTHLEQCATLARSGRVLRMTVATGLDRLGESVDLLKRELALAPPASSMLREARQRFDRSPPSSASGETKQPVRGPR